MKIKFKLIILKAITSFISANNNLLPEHRQQRTRRNASMHSFVLLRYRPVNMFAHMHRIIIETSVNRYALHDDVDYDDDADALSAPHQSKLTGAGDVMHAYMLNM